MAKTYDQTPTEKIDYEINIEGGEIIMSTVWTSTVNDSGAALTIGTPVNTATQTKTRIYGVRLGKLFTVNVHIVGGTGQEYDVTFHIYGNASGRL